MKAINWRPCIVTVFDAVGIRKIASTGNGSSAMIDMHQLAIEKINGGMPHHSYAYVWNDSLMCVSYETKPPKRRMAVLDELDKLKKSIQADSGLSLYAISVMGLAFPDDHPRNAMTEGQPNPLSRVVFLKTSSWALANCFVIEKELKRHKADWYIDSRISRNTSLRAPDLSEKIELLPKSESRDISMFRGQLFESND